MGSHACATRLQHEMKRIAEGRWLSRSFVAMARSTSSGMASIGGSFTLFGLLGTPAESMLSQRPEPIHASVLGIFMRLTG